MAYNNLKKIFFNFNNHLLIPGRESDLQASYLNIQKSHLRWKINL